MLPSSSSQLAARCGHLNHYKKFWLLQSTQLDKQDHTSNSPSLISLQGSPSNCIINPAAPCNKDTTSKPLLIPSSHHAAIAASHQPANSCRSAVDTATTFGSGSINSSSRFTIGVCNSNEPSSACVSSSHFMNVQRYVGHEAAVLSMGRDDGPRLNLAVNCGNTPVDAPVKSANEESWRSSTTRCQKPSFVPSERQSAQVISEISLASHDDKCDSSESSLEVEKRGWSIPPIYQGSSAASTALLRNFMHDELAHEDKSFPIEFRGSNLPLSYVDHMGTSSSAPLSFSGSPRTCTLCGTTKTPLWRSGPDGPKSLCNACGIRVKKTKRLEAALQATATSGSSSPSPALSGNVYKGAFKRKLSTSKEPCNLQKKRRRVAFPSKGNIHMSPSLFKQEFSCDHSNFSGKLDFATPKLAQLVPHDGRDPAKTFAKDVEEAAVMLMALSCGLVLS